MALTNAPFSNLKKALACHRLTRTYCRGGRLPLSPGIGFYCRKQLSRVGNVSFRGRNCEARSPFTTGASVRSSAFSGFDESDDETDKYDDDTFEHAASENSYDVDSHPRCHFSEEAPDGRNLDEVAEDVTCNSCTDFRFYSSEALNKKRTELDGLFAKSSSVWNSSTENCLRRRIADISMSEDTVSDISNEDDDVITLEDMHQVLSQKEASRLVNECYEHVTSAFDRMETNLAALEVLDKKNAFDSMEGDVFIKLLTAAEESIQYLKVAYVRVQLNKTNPLNREIVRKVNARFLEKSTNWHLTYSSWEQRVGRIRVRFNCPSTEDC